MIARLRARVMRQWAIVSTALLGWMLLSAHVGTTQVVFEGRAGGYPVRVMINPPGVVPAQVPISVRVLEGTPTRVTVRAAQWNVGTKGAPPAEPASLVPGDPGVWAHDLWIMTASTYAVYVSVEGPAGNGSVVVPMQTAATRTLAMTRGMSVLLGVLGVLLVSGLLTIVGAAVREGSLPAGDAPSSARRRTARIAIASTASLLALALVGGSKWWDAEAAAYRRSMLKPLRIESTVRSVDANRVLTITIVDSLWRSNRLLPLMPDHGKLMHLFLVDAGAQQTLAHLHPLRVAADAFVTRVPAMPAGRYLLFGDLLFQNGAQRTLVDTIDVPVAPVVVGDDPASGEALPLSASVAASAAASTIGSGAGAVPAVDADDAWRSTVPTPLGQTVSLASGGRITLSIDSASRAAGGAVRAGRDLRLTVSVQEADGSPSALEPYMGMGGHAMVLRSDAAIFMHLHPMGTASMTAQAQLLRRERGDTAILDSASIAQVIRSEEATDPSMHAMHAVAPLSFPFAFPTAGRYRVFVQVKRNGVVETAAFDISAVAAKVNPA